MAKRKTDFRLTETTEVDVVACKGNQVVIRPMSLIESRRIVKKKGWVYNIFQKGFHNYKNK